MTLPAQPVSVATRSNDRTKDEGDSPREVSSLSIEFRTLVTRPKASAAAQSPTTSRSAGFG